MTSYISYSYASEANNPLSSIDPFLLNDEDLSRSRKPSMVETNMFNIPLSPPTSPRLAAFQSEQAENSWQEHQSQQASHENTQEGSESNNNLSLIHTEIAPSLSLDTKPMLRTHKSFPYTLRTSGTSAPDTPPLNHSGDSPSSVDDLSTPNLGDVSSVEMPAVTFGGSEPTSPLSNMTPTSPRDDDDLNGLNISLDGEDGEKKPMTAAEIRAQKRKMKRFRLTHNQTRFLMSEFARQAHPDAAHRERLAREIPGLTPRQVQVWFQNRRAKLKRLTSEDRDRMMRSRALPDDFDMHQALHSPFSQIQNVNSSTLSSPSGYSPLSAGDGQFPQRPLGLELRRMPENGHHMSPIPGYSPFTFTPPQSNDGLSPISPGGNESPFSFSPSIGGPERRGNPFGGLTSPSTAFTSHPQIPRLHMHDGPRSRPEALSPLRPTMSYPGQGDMSPSSPLGGPESNGPTMMPYGLSGYSYPNSNNNPSGFAANQGNNPRLRFGTANAPPRRIEVGPPSTSRPGYSPTRTEAPQSSTFPHYTSSPMTSNSFPMMSSAPHHVTSFPNSFLRPGSPGDQYSTLGDNDDSNDQSSEHLTAF